MEVGGTAVGCITTFVEVGRIVAVSCGVAVRIVAAVAVEVAVI